MHVKTLKTFQSTLHGNLVADQIMDVPPSLAALWVQHGLAEVVASEVADPGPFGVSGEGKMSPSSQAAQASQKKIAITQVSEPEPSQSTPATSEPEIQTQSMPATADGGESTQAKCKEAPKGGRRTRRQRSSSS